MKVIDLNTEKEKEKENLFLRRPPQENDKIQFPTIVKKIEIGKLVYILHEGG